MVKVLEDRLIETAARADLERLTAALDQLSDTEVEERLENPGEVTASSRSHRILQDRPDKGGRDSQSR